MKKAFGKLLRLSVIAVSIIVVVLLISYLVYTGHQVW